jgi:Rieske Fe-S protein
MSAEIDRREFVAVCAGGLGMLLSGCVSLVTHPVPVVGGRIRLTLASFPELANAEGAIKIQPEGRADPIYVLATARRDFTALSPICTHRGCTVDVQGSRLVCPCHGSTYDRDGVVLRGPAQKALTRYGVTREGDYLLVDLTGAGS